MNILITAPSLNEADNVSGISTIVRTIIGFRGAAVNFQHFRIGNKDGLSKGFRWALDQATLLPRMARFIRKNNIEAIHLNTDFTKPSLLRDFMILSFIKLVVRKPVLLHVHGGYMLMSPPKKNSIYWLIIKRLLKKSDINVILTRAEQEQLLSSFGAESRVLPNAVASLESNPSVKNFDREIKFFFLGKIVKTKGIFLIAEALKQLSEYHHTCSFTLYGAGPDLPALLQELEAIKTLKFDFKGVVFGAEKWKAIDNANVFLLPSYSEGLPIAMLEAMQFGCIPVVTDEPSIMAVVKNSVNGFIIKKYSSDALAAAMKNILTDRKNLKQVSEAAERTVAENYSISKYMETLLSYYASLSN
ncbi:MAG: glycosyltransferase family 4 protein [Chitinophagaceae bacterium]